jgi:hypothetical protein
MAGRSPMTLTVDFGTTGSGGAAGGRGGVGCGGDGGGFGGGRCGQLGSGGEGNAGGEGGSSGNVGGDGGGKRGCGGMGGMGGGDGGGDGDRGVDGGRSMGGGEGGGVISKNSPTMYWLSSQCGPLSTAGARSPRASTSCSSAVRAYRALSPAGRNVGGVKSRLTSARAYDVGALPSTLKLRRGFSGCGALAGLCVTRCCVRAGTVERRSVKGVHKLELDCGDRSAHAKRLRYPGTHHLNHLHRRQSPVPQLQLGKHPSHVTCAQVTQ